MNQIVNITAASAAAVAATEALTMSSREIAKLTGKAHSTVLRDIKTMLISLYGEEHIVKTVPEHRRNRHSEYIRENADSILKSVAGDDANWLHPNNPAFRWKRDKRGYVMLFELDKSHTFTLVTGYNVKMRKSIIDRWMELEEEAQGREAKERAGDQQTMPMPELFAQLMQQQTETLPFNFDGKFQPPIYPIFRANTSTVADIRDMLDELDINGPKFGGVNRELSLNFQQKPEATTGRRWLGLSKFGDTYRDRSAAGWTR